MAFLFDFKHVVNNTYFRTSVFSVYSKQNVFHINICVFRAWDMCRKIIRESWCIFRFMRAQLVWIDGEKSSKHSGNKLKLGKSWKNMKTRNKQM